MSLVDDEDPMEEADLDLTTTTNDMEIDTKIKIEEVTINLGCVKRELDDETDYGESSGVNQYRIGENSFKRRDDEDNFMNFSTGDNKIKIENANIKKLYCNNCNGNYVGYCIYCTSLSHIINNVIPNLNSESDFYTIPGDVLGIRDVFERRAVFALKTIPKDVIFGPYHGISAIESTNGCGWKVKNWKFLNDENGNWMRNVCASNQFAKNLDIFQCDKNIYFQTSREIEEGEELLVWYNEEVTQKLENGEECYYVPVEKDESSKIFACTLCCLGFRLERCLVEHKSKCPHAEYNEECEDLEIVECRSCKVWLERQEHLESHMLYCLENCNRGRNKRSNLEWRNADGVDETLGNIDPLQLNEEDGSATDRLELHLNTRSDVKPFQCGICKMSYSRKSNLKLHIENKHSNTSEQEYKCPECSYHAKCKLYFKRHLNTHNNVKPFECDICKKTFLKRIYLKQHIRNHHSNTDEKEYTCSECSYQTNYRSHLKRHLNVHRGVKPFACNFCEEKFLREVSLKLHVEKKHGSATDTSGNSTQDLQDNKIAVDSDIKPYHCGICGSRFMQNRSLKEHMRCKHTNISEKDYKCSHCSYQTNYKGYLKVHLNTHRDIKPYQCDICNQKYTRKTSLNLHIENKHSNTGEKKYTCSKCSYKTNHLQYLRLHLNTHSDVKRFQCDICKISYSRNSNLKLHIENKHSNASEKEYKCSECSYEAKCKLYLQRHLNTHNDVKPFECDICKKTFLKRIYLKEHIRNHHSKTDVKEYKCTECSYQTNHRSHLKRHLNVHRDVKSFACDSCEENFLREVNLKLHIEKKHSHTNEIN